MSFQSWETYQRLVGWLSYYCDVTTYLLQVRFPVCYIQFEAFCVVTFGLDLSPDTIDFDLLL